MVKQVDTGDLKSPAQRRAGSSPARRTKFDKYCTMDIKIYINDKLYRSVTVEGEKYNPADYWPQIERDKEAGLLNSFNIQETMKVEFRVQ